MNEKSQRPIVLVADEDKDIRFLIQIYLRDYDIGFLEARDGRECLELVRKEKPQLVVLNYMLDKLTGYQVAKEISEDESLKNIPVIMMTIEGFDLIKENTGVDDYLAKPFNRSLFIETVEKITEGGILKKKRKDIKEVTPAKSIETKKELKKKTGERKKILVADDEPDILKLLKFILEDNYDLDFAYSGEELAKKATSSDYDLIIADVVMPVLSGWKSVKKIRESGCNIPVIFNSGLVKDKELYETLKPEGPSCFVLKPFKRDELLTQVKKFID